MDVSAEKTMVYDAAYRIAESIFHLPFEFPDCVTEKEDKAGCLYRKLRFIIPLHRDPQQICFILLENQEEPSLQSVNDNLLLFIEKLLSLPVSDPTKNRRLQWAVTFAHTEVVKMMLDKKSGDPKKLFGLLMTYGYNEQKKEIMELLLADGRIHPFDSDYLLLRWAVKHGVTDYLDKILKSNDTRKLQKLNLFHLSIHPTPHIGIIDLLLKDGRIMPIRSDFLNWVVGNNLLSTMKIILHDDRFMTLYINLRNALLNMTINNQCMPMTYLMLTIHGIYSDFLNMQIQKIRADAMNPIFGPIKSSNCDKTAKFIENKVGCEREINYQRFGSFFNKSSEAQCLPKEIQNTIGLFYARTCHLPPECDKSMSFTG